MTSARLSGRLGAVLDRAAECGRPEALQPAPRPAVDACGNFWAFPSVSVLAVIG
jgi:hypothetical protein